MPAYYHKENSADGEIRVNILALEAQKYDQESLWDTITTFLTPGEYSRYR